MKKHKYTDIIIQKVSIQNILVLNFDFGTEKKIQRNHSITS